MSWGRTMVTPIFLLVMVTCASFGLGSFSPKQSPLTPDRFGQRLDRTPHILHNIQAIGDFGSNIIPEFHQQKSNRRFLDTFPSGYGNLRNRPATFTDSRLARRVNDVQKDAGTKRTETKVSESLGHIENAVNGMRVRDFNIADLDKARNVTSFQLPEEDAFMINHHHVFRNVDSWDPDRHFYNDYPSQDDSKRSKKDKDDHTPDDILGHKLINFNDYVNDIAINMNYGLGQPSVVKDTVPLQPKYHGNLLHIPDTVEHPDKVFQNNNLLPDVNLELINSEIPQKTRSGQSGNKSSKFNASRSIDEKEQTDRYSGFTRRQDAFLTQKSAGSGIPANKRQTDSTNSGNALRLQVSDAPTVLSYKDAQVFHPVTPQLQYPAYPVFEPASVRDTTDDEQSTPDSVGQLLNTIFEVEQRTAELLNEPL